MHVQLFVYKHQNMFLMKTANTLKFVDFYNIYMKQEIFVWASEIICEYMQTTESPSFV